MVKYNKQEIYDKVKACWVGKNIGGTLGGPYECTKDILNVTGFITKPGEPLPNDDLDLQLVWLYAMEKEGPHNMSANILGEYWISYVPAHWNEYGICKSNLKAGLMPPMSGQFNNEQWSKSNGAWIRSEIWACMSPGFADIACKYAIMDGCVDHGLDEGTYAEIFTTCMESFAFFENDIRKIIDMSLEKIPAESRIAKSVRTVIEYYDKGIDWKETRNKLVEDSADIGWFQAPANIGFTILGLLYGEGDFKKSMLYAINCGDDTDCTAATIGAFLGILNGMKGIPQDWSEYIGDKIISIAIDLTNKPFPTTCTELTERTINMIPSVMKAHGIDVEFTDEPTEIGEINHEFINNCALGADYERLLEVNTNTTGTYNFIHTEVCVSFPENVKIEPNGSIKINARLFNRLHDQRMLHFNLILPEGWTAKYEKSILSTMPPRKVYWEATITAGENTEPTNRVILEVWSPSRPTIGLIPIVIMG